jgi:ribosomal protein L3 glutamine methyltransferase
MGVVAGAAGLVAGAAQHLSPDGILVVEIGHNRTQLEAAYPRVPFTWLETHAGDEFVFVLTREQLP